MSSTGRLNTRWSRIGLAWPALSAALAFGAPSIAMAQTVVLPASQDTTLYEDNPTRSNGAGNHILTGRNGSNSTRRGLVQFDIAASVPQASAIDAVTLTLTVSRGNGPDQIVELHRVLAPWGEAGSQAAGEEGGGADAMIGDATWSHRIWNNVLWATPGGDFSPTVSGTALVGMLPEPAVLDVAWTSPQMVADVQGWLDNPATNNGWALVSTAGAATMTRRFDSRTNADPAVRPRLSVSFTPTVVIGACCAPDGTCGTVESPGTDCVGTYQGDDTDCGGVSCPQPEGACCFADAAATCSELTADDCAAQDGAFVGQFVPCDADLCPVVPTPFLDPLPIPPTAVPTSTTPGEPDHYEIAFREFEQTLHSELPPTRVWGFNDGTSGDRYPGPSFDVESGQPIEVVWRNDLRDESGVLRTEHFLPVDMCMMGAMEPDPRTVIHFHGGHVAADSDGHPMDTFLPGQEVTYQYPNAQRAAGLWYHDHSLGITRLNVYMGMAGAYFIRDAEEAALGLPSGADEVPLVIQDRTFRADGSLVYPEMWMEHHFGNVLLVNGRVWPRLDVPQGKMRFRVLNGSGTRTYRLRLSTGDTMQIIGSDGGLLAAPTTVSQVLLQPGERADVIIDFAGYAAGTSVVLENDAPAPYPGGGDMVPTNVMRFDVTNAVGHTDPIPSPLSFIPEIDEAASVVNRDLVLRKEPDPCTGEAWRINGLSMDDITEMPTLGTSEIWRFFNDSGFSHPMHMHLVMFRLLDRQPYDLVDGEHVPSGPIELPTPEEAGWKDTIRVDPFTKVRVIAKFENYTGMFAYHCHILEHEDHDMMRQFMTMTDCGDGALGMPDEECDDGNLDDGDGCDSDCNIEPSGSGGGGGSGGAGGSGGESGSGGAGVGGDGGSISGPGAGGGGAGGSGPGNGGASGTGGESPSASGSGGTDGPSPSSSTAASSASGGPGGGGGAAPGDDGGNADDGGCSCELAGHDPSNLPAQLVLAGAAMAVISRKRRHRHSRS